MEFKTPQDEIAHQRQALLAMWNLFADCVLGSDKPDEIRRSTAFAKVDRHLRELGILPPVGAPK